jgi:hypothetical protein
MQLSFPFPFSALVLYICSVFVPALAVTVSQTDFGNPQFTVLNKGTGQSFTPDVLGDGSGTYGSQTMATLDSFTFRFSNVGPGYALASSTQLNLYSTLPDPDDLGAATGALYSSTNTVGDDTERTVTWIFEDAFVAIDSVYFAMLSSPRQLVYSFEDNPYTGGQAHYLDNANEYVTATPNLDVWFEAELTAVPEPAASGLLVGLACLALARRASAKGAAQ